LKTPENVDNDLLEAYMEMPNKAMVNGDGQLTYHCAYSFPAVFLTMGKDSWDKLGGLYKTLESDMQYKVRRCLAFSIHEVAKIMGSEACEINLIPSFDLFFSDVDEVKIGVISNLVNFISVLSERKRLEFLSYFSDIQKENIKWRNRRIISKQIFQLVDLYSPKKVFEVIYPISFALVNDTFNSVRKKAFKGVNIFFFLSFIFYFILFFFF
jgi:serine/threonine-protein phosphatase 4 regulatory subunit 1